MQKKWLTIAILGAGQLAWAQQVFAQEAAQEQPAEAPAVLSDEDKAKAEAELQAQMEAAKQQVTQTQAPTALPAAETAAVPTSAGTTSAGTTSAGTTSAGTTSAGTTSAGTTSAGTTSAAPVAGAPSVSGIVAQTQLSNAEEIENAQNGFGIAVTLDHAVGTGTFLQNDALRASRATVSQSWSFAPSYTFKFMGHRPRFVARLAFDLEYTTPDNPAGRRWNTSDAFVSLIDPFLYVEKNSGIVIGASVRAGIPMSYQSIRASSSWGSVGGSLRILRSFGPILLTWTPGYTKFLNSSAVANSYSRIAREGEVAQTPSRIQDPFVLDAGFANTSFRFVNTFGVNYDISDNLSASYSVSIRNSFAYNIAERDEFTSINADGGRGRTDDLTPALELSYNLTSAFRENYKLPIGVVLAAGIVAQHPAQTEDNRGIMWPVFVQAFNRAAENYGSFYFDVIGTYF